MLPMFRRCILSPSSVSKCVGWVSFCVYVGLCLEKTTEGGKVGGWRPVRANMDYLCSYWLVLGNIYMYIQVYLQILIHSVHFQPEDGGSICLRIAGNIVHIYTV
jgi:hypothetical protein